MSVLHSELLIIAGITLAGIGGGAYATSQNTEQIATVEQGLGFVRGPGAR